MARILYLDCAAGAAGDMVLGALLDAGVPVDALRAALGSLGVDHELRVSRVLRAGVSANRVEVIEKAHHHEHGHKHDHGHGHHHHHSLEQIGKLIDGSALSASGKARARGLFQRIGEAEAAIHGVGLDKIHLHEVGAVDSIIDIVGAVFAFEWLGIDTIIASPLNVGSGTVTIAHGTFPVPAPATLRLLGSLPVYGSQVAAELVTPTGALLLSEYATGSGPMPAMTVERVGYGAGTRELDPIPNVLRAIVGQMSAAAAPPETILQIECELDDMNPQLFGPLSDRLFAVGAVDVFLTAVQMKKGRPGTLVTVLCPAGLRSAVRDLLFRETTTLGMRIQLVERETLDRRHETVEVAGGAVRMKIAERAGEVFSVAPEFDDCLRIADADRRPVKAVQAEALRTWYARNPQARM